MKKNKGFTLIELLVVIAIIGVLASVVLAALTSARSKGNDTAVKSNLANTRSQAELYYGTNSPNSYTGICGTATNAAGTKSINGMVLAAAQSVLGSSATLNIAIATAGTGTTSTCHETATGWAAEAPLSGSTNAAPKMWCVDSTGASEQNSTALAANGVLC